MKHNSNASKTYKFTIVYVSGGNETNIRICIFEIIVIRFVLS